MARWASPHPPPTRQQGPPPPAAAAACCNTPALALFKTLTAACARWRGGGSMQVRLTAGCRRSLASGRENGAMSCDRRAVTTLVCVHHRRATDVPLLSVPGLSDALTEMTPALSSSTVELSTVSAGRSEGGLGQISSPPPVTPQQPRLLTDQRPLGSSRRTQDSGSVTPSSDNSSRAAQRRRSPIK